MQLVDTDVQCFYIIYIYIECDLNSKSVKKTKTRLNEKDSEHKQVACCSSDKQAKPLKLSRQQATVGKSPRLLMP